MIYVRVAVPKETWNQDRRTTLVPSQHKLSSGKRRSLRLITGVALAIVTAADLSACSMSGQRQSPAGKAGRASQSCASLPAGYLTSAQQPDSMTLETKVRDIGRLNVDQRIAFIRSVGEAARLLTDDQRSALLGMGSPQAAQTNGAMGDM